MTHVCFKLHEKNFIEFQNVFGQIHWMYFDMITSYGGFGHNIDYEKIDYKKFFFTSADKSMEYYSRQIDIVKQGSLVALSCEVYNLLDDELRNEKVYCFIKEILSNPLINNMPFEKNVLMSMLNALDEQISLTWTSLPHGSILIEKLKEVYKRYVLDYYKGLIAEGK